MLFVVVEFLSWGMSDDDVFVINFVVWDRLRKLDMRRIRCCEVSLVDSLHISSD